jgi:hypothetical protein
VRTSDAPRSTHFADKEELLSGLDDLRRMIRSAGRAGKPLAFTPGLLDHAHENKRMFRALLGKRAISARMCVPALLHTFLELQRTQSCTQEEDASNQQATCVVRYPRGEPGSAQRERDTAEKADEKAQPRS